MADDGVHGLEIALKEKPDLILTDVRMPRMSGVEMAEEILKALPNAIILFMSAYSDKEYLKAAIKLKAVSYVDKPLDMNELMSSSNSVSITTAAIMTALNYRDELEKASGSADNMRRQIKDYLEDAASAKMAAEELRRENAALRKKVDDLHRRSLTSEA